MEEPALRTLDDAMVRFADGDRSAGPVVFGIVWPELVRFAERTLGERADAHDVAQLALEKVFAQASRYDRERSALAWCLALVSWECRTVLQQRRRRREETLEGADEALDPDADPEARAIDAATRAALHAALEGLASRDREALEEAYFREVDGPRTPAVRKRKERALSKLRSIWRAIHGD